MSEYLRLLNSIKCNCSKSWFTESQKIIFDEVCSYLKRIPTFVNIYGNEGSGKTFLAWELSKELDFDYYCSIKDIVTPSNGMIIDNVNFIDFNYRLIYELFLDFQPIILISETKTKEYIKSFNLNVTPTDIETFKTNLITLGQSSIYTKSNNLSACLLYTILKKENSSSNII